MRQHPNPNRNQMMHHSDMNEIDMLFEEMTKISGYDKSEIISPNRQRPLPAIRWILGNELYKRGYSLSRSARILNIDHATLLHGIKKLKQMSTKNGYYEETTIKEKFESLCR